LFQVISIIAAIVRACVWAIQSLPLTLAARVGRSAGTVAWWCDRRHRRVALENLKRVFPEKSEHERRAIARENFCRIGENYTCALKTSTLSRSALNQYVEWKGVAEFLPDDGRSMVGAVGHFGNFELFARVNEVAPQWQVATTYRALPNPQLNAILQRVRLQTGARFFERRTEARQLRDFLRKGNVMLGLLADQHAGDRGLWLPFLGHSCSCSAAPAIYALRYQTPLCVAVCYRTGLARWLVEICGLVPTHKNDGEPRTPEEITLEINRHYEAAIRRDPANWFWVHRRWKPISLFQQGQASLESPGTEADQTE
jgi:lauroyl/myristoyl acyltransferase